MSKKLWTGLSLFLLASMVLTACAAPATSAPPATVVVTQIVQGTPQTIVVTATPVPPTEPPPTAAPQESDTVVMALGQEPDTLHPVIGTMSAMVTAEGGIFVGCMGQDEKATWVPLGCNEVPTIDNGGAKWVGDGADKHLEITHTIRKGWRWTDGQPVTSADAIYTWKLEMDPDVAYPGRTSPEEIYDITAPDASTYVVKLLSEKQVLDAVNGKLTGNVNFAAFKDDYNSNYGPKWKGPVTDPLYWTDAALGWLPEHLLSKIAGKDQAASDFAKKPVGDGPYVVADWKAGQELDEDLSDQPFPLGTPKIKHIVFRFITDQAAIIAALQNGEIDAVANPGGLQVSNAPDLDKIDAAGVYKTYYLASYAWEHIDLNTTKAPLDDVKVRQALYYAIDKQQLVDKLYFGKYTPTAMPAPAGLYWAYPDPSQFVQYPFDKDKAAALLKDAGWDCSTYPCTKTVNGKKVKLEFTLMTTDRADRQALAQVIQGMWKKLNIGVNIQFLYGRGLFATCDAGGPLNCRTFDAADYTWSTGDDPQFLGLYGCAGLPPSGQNYPGWCNKAADADLQQAEANPDVSLSKDKRKPYLADFFKQWTTDVPVIPLFSVTTVTVARVGFKNWKPGPTQYAPETWNTWEWELTK